MKKIILALALLLAPSLAFAQCNGVFSASSLCGSVAGGVPGPIPFSSIPTGGLVIGGSAISGGTTNGLLYNNAGLLGNLASGNNGVLITSGGGVPSISSTIPSATQANITQLGTITTGVWNGTIVTGAFGGTGVNNGTNTITVAGNLATTGGAVTIATGTTGIPYWNTNTLAVSGTMTLNGVVYGGGASAAPLSTAQGAANTVLIANAGAPAFSTTPTVTTLNATTGFQIAGAATSANVLRGNGTNFISSVLAVGDLNLIAASTFVGNSSSSSNVPVAFTIDGLTNKASPVGGDELVLADSAASFGMKKCTITNCLAAVTAGVASIDAQTGTFTTANGIDSTAKVIELTAARRTLPTVQGPFNTGTGATYTTPANVLWIEVYFTAGGGGGGGSGTASQTSGGAGGTTTFNSVNASGGGGGSASSTGTNSGGAFGGPVAAAGTGTATRRFSGTDGSPGNGGVAGAFNGTGGNGGASGHGTGGGGRGGASSTAGNVGNGCGGGGGGAGGASGGQGASGGGAGGETGYLLINTPAATYTYTVGAAGTAGAAGTSGFAGGAGVVGCVFVIEHYGT